MRQRPRGFDTSIRSIHERGTRTVIWTFAILAGITL